MRFRQAAPTRFEDLNEVLEELTTRTARILANNFVGAYLGGSFALGAADEHSDVDFIVVSTRPLSSSEESGIRRMHAEFPDRSVIWAQHLEGSYPPQDKLRTMEAIGRQWLYVDNGAKVMEWSTHCNTAVVRWTLREMGVVLAGPKPRMLIDPITLTDLRTDARRALQTYVEWIEDDPSVLDDAWNQPYIVTTLSRIMLTIATGRVATKRESLEWVKANVDARWAPLLDAAIDGRPDPWDRVGKPANADTVAPTQAFVEYVARASRMD